MLHFERKQNCVIVQLKCKSIITIHIFFFSFILFADGAKNKVWEEEFTFFTTEIANRMVLYVCLACFPYVIWKRKLLEATTASTRQFSYNNGDATHYIRFYMCFYVPFQYTEVKQHTEQNREGKYLTCTKASCRWRLSFVCWTCTMFTQSDTSPKSHTLNLRNHYTARAHTTTVQHILVGHCVSSIRFPLHCDGNSLFSFMWIVNVENCIKIHDEFPIVFLFSFPIFHLNINRTTLCLAESHNKIRTL